MKIKNIKCRKSLVGELSIRIKKRFLQELPDYFFTDITLENIRERGKENGRPKQKTGLRLSQKKSNEKWKKKKNS